MYTTEIPNDKRTCTDTFSLQRTTQSDFQLLVDLLDKVSNEILLTDILKIVPAYNSYGLVLHVIYVTY